jgi:hypothetical protein
MPSIDIKIDAELEKTLTLPLCKDIELPKAGGMKIELPAGGALKAFTDLSKGIPTDCALTFSLLIQIAPLLASLECLVKILALLDALISVIKGLPFPPFAAIKKFMKAAAELAPCIAMPAKIPFFVRDILCVILKALKCIISQLDSIVKILGGLSLQIQAAEASGNTAQLAALECAKKNAEQSAASALQAIDPLKALLGLMTPFLAIAGQGPISMPTTGPGVQVEALNTVVTTLKTVAEAITLVTDALGGCDG